MRFKNRIFVCLCEDVTLEDVLKAIEDGNDDIESLKRATGVGTGICQGKYCLNHLARILAERTGKSLNEVGLPKARPPTKPVKLGVFAKLEG
ncbi:(2Fe-2S)-binding protein [Candidatus Bathyarchaeota archaeon ex4484_205]|nr:MAG: (2Fe-2S)-binding protein [Candidatus Bathyarchaeota archaeon ex4484_205]RLF90280.1 MAG: (2Fe-2S)-binding protein [Thermococci archaeon]RLF96676.1 MAG: (2Fe-2S)-binding protein [Thermococci archaeon]